MLRCALCVSLLLTQMGIGALLTEEAVIVNPGQPLENFTKRTPDDDPVNHFKYFLEELALTKHRPSTCELEVVDNTVKKGYTREKALRVKVYLAANVHSWGTYCSLVHWPDKLMDLSKVDGVQFWIRVLKADDVVFRWSFYDQRGDQFERWSTDDKRWKGAKILKVKNEQWQEVKIYFGGLPGKEPGLKIPWWAQERNDGKFDLSRIGRWEISIASTSSAARSVELEISEIRAFREKKPEEYNNSSLER